MVSLAENPSDVFFTSSNNSTVVVTSARLVHPQSETNVAAGKIIEAGTAATDEQYKAFGALINRFSARLQLDASMAQASGMITRLVGGDTLEELMEQTEGLQEETKRFNAGRKTPEKIADAILEEQTESINVLNKFFSEAERVLGVDNGDVSDFRTQLVGLQEVYIATIEAREGQGSTLNDTQLKGVEKCNEDFEAISASKNFVRLLNRIEQNPEMQKEGRERAGSDSSNDSGIGRSSPGMGGPS